MHLLTVPCSEGRGWSVDSYRHDMVTLISMGEVNVVETLHWFWPCYKSQGQRGDPQGQMGERSWIPVQGLRYGPQGRQLCPPASEHLPWAAGWGYRWEVELQQALKPHDSHLPRSECGHSHSPRSTETKDEGKATTQNVDGENTFASICSGNPEQNPGRYRSVINHHISANIHLSNESKLKQRQRACLSYPPNFQFNSSQALKIRDISSENCH